MQTDKLIVYVFIFLGGLVALGTLSGNATNEISNPPRVSFAKSEFGKSDLLDGKIQIESKNDAVKLSLRTSESYEMEYGSSPEATLRAEVSSVDSTLEPILRISNKRALTDQERARVENGLRKRQALLKILIDRQIGDSKKRARI